MGTQFNEKLQGFGRNSPKLKDKQNDKFLPPANRYSSMMKSELSRDRKNMSRQTANTLTTRETDRRNMRKMNLEFDYV